MDLEFLSKRLTKTLFNTMTLSEYIEEAQKNPKLYASVADRILSAVGEPVLVDTSKNNRLSRIYNNKTIKVYKAFEDFYGMEDIIERTMAYFRHASQGLEESRQVLFFMGSVGTAKSSLVERLKSLAEVNPIYVIKINGELSPVYESPLGLFKKADAEKLKLPPHLFKEIMSPWLLKRLKEINGDLSKVEVAEVYPSKQDQIAIDRVEPADENNQDVTSLVGSLDIKRMTKYGQNDPDAYSYSGGLCRSNQGVLEFVEMFKAPIKLLHPLLIAPQEGFYRGVNNIGSIPYSGLILSHSNMSEWSKFASDKNNEAFLDRIYKITVPYVMHYSDEEKIYKKLLDNSELKNAPIAPKTLSLLAKFCVASRFEEESLTAIRTKLEVFDGQNIKEFDTTSKSYLSYKEELKPNEGLDGLSTRFAFKVLSKVFNFNNTEISANAIHLFQVLDDTIKKEFANRTEYGKLVSILENLLKPEYLTFIEKEIQEAYIENNNDYGQNLFDRYIKIADNWLQEVDFKDPVTGELWNKDALHKELVVIENEAGIQNFAEFRQEVVSYVHRIKATTGENVSFKSYKKMKKVIEKIMFQSMETLLPIISFGDKEDSEIEKKHKGFVERMEKLGYTRSQIKVVVDWFIRYRRS